MHSCHVRWQVQIFWWQSVGQCIFSFSTRLKNFLRQNWRSGRINWWSLLTPWTLTWCVTQATHRVMGIVVSRRTCFTWISQWTRNDWCFLRNCSRLSIRRLIAQTVQSWRWRCASWSRWSSNDFDAIEKLLKVNRKRKSITYVVIGIRRNDVRLHDALVMSAVALVAPTELSLLVLKVVKNRSWIKQINVGGSFSFCSNWRKWNAKNVWVTLLCRLSFCISQNC